MAKKNCGCHITWDRETRYGIYYCSVHAAAFEMRDVLKEIVTAFDKENVIIFKRNEIKEVQLNPLRQTPAFLDICKRALSLAEGKEADHGKPIDP